MLANFRVICSLLEQNVLINRTSLSPRSHSCTSNLFESSRAPFGQSIRISLFRNPLKPPCLNPLAYNRADKLLSLTKKSQSSNDRLLGLWLIGDATLKIPLAYNATGELLLPLWFPEPSHTLSLKYRPSQRTAIIIYDDCKTHIFPVPLDSTSGQISLACSILVCLSHSTASTLVNQFYARFRIGLNNTQDG